MRALWLLIIFFVISRGTCILTEIDLKEDKILDKHQEKMKEMEKILKEEKGGDEYEHADAIEDENELVYHGQEMVTIMNNDGDFEETVYPYHDIEKGKMDSEGSLHVQRGNELSWKSMNNGTFNENAKRTNSGKGIRNSTHRISVRQASQCQYPHSLKDSQLLCTTYPNKVVCVHTCMFGYTFTNMGRGSITRTMECNMKEDRWKPVAEFEKCQPFIDCGVTIGPGGSYKCHKNFMDKGAECDISCAHFEDKEAVPVAKYQCDIRGNWSPKLPFCARAGSGIKLVRPPYGPKSMADL